MLVNRDGLDYAEVRASLAQMAQTITLQAKAMTDQLNRYNVQRENLLVRRMADRIRDFTRMNPPILILSKTSKDQQEFVDEVHNIYLSMASTITWNAKWASY